LPMGCFYISGTELVSTDFNVSDISFPGTSGPLA